VANADDANFLKSLDGVEGFDFWSMKRLLGSSATVMVQPERQKWFEKSLMRKNIDYKILFENLEK
jgi:hypothetical protein